jgi:hypothetical protein
MKRAKLLLIGCVIATTVLITACPPRKSIADINRDPARWANREVSIAGTVTHSYGALGTGIYEVDDGTGKMWVLSERYGVPSDGARVAVTGTIVPTVTFAGKSYATVLRETERRK